MIQRGEILDTAATLGLRPQVVEKDYVLGWVLAGIYQHTALAEHWIFKGGTCLKKCYFETYRFSEDLDFTVIEPSQNQEEFLSDAFREIADWIYDRAGIEIPQELREFQLFTNPRGTVSCQGKLSYRGPIAPRSGGLPRVSRVSQIGTDGSGAQVGTEVPRRSDAHRRADLQRRYGVVGRFLL